MATAMTTWAAIGLLLAAATGCGGDDTATGGGTGGAAPEPQTPLEAIEAKVGTYEGTWEMFARGAAGDVSSAMTWTDVATATNPAVETTRAFVTVTDAMTMADGSSLTQSWTEGVLIEPDGSVGPQFIEMSGVVTQIDEIAPDHFHYETELSPSDFFFLEGITKQNLIAGHHSTDKVVEHPNGGEQHNIHRTTHLEWTDANAQKQTDDFTSLVGTHKKTK